MDKRRTEGGAEVKQGPGRGLRERPTARPESGSVASGPASSPASLACGEAVRGKIAGGGTGRGQRGTSKKTWGLGRGGSEVLAHLFIFLADQLLGLGQRQHWQRDLCSALAGELTRGRGDKGTGNQGRDLWLWVTAAKQGVGRGWGLGGGAVSFVAISKVGGERFWGSGLDGEGGVRDREGRALGAPRTELGFSPAAGSITRPRPGQAL